MQNSASETILILGLFNIIFLASGLSMLYVFFTGNSRNYFIKESAYYFLAHSVYMTISAIGAKIDTVASIGFSAFFSFFPMYFHVRLIRSYNCPTAQRHDKKALMLCAVCGTLSILLYVAHFDYLSFAPLHNSFFTSFTLPFPIALSFLGYKSVLRFIKSKSFQNKIGAFIVPTTTLSTFYLSFCRLNPEHTDFGYGSILAVLLISYITLNALIFKNLTFYFQDAHKISKRTWALKISTDKLIKNVDPIFSNDVSRINNFISDIEKKADDYLLDR